MALSVQVLVDTACLLAGPRGIKQGHTAELLVPRVLVWVAQRAAAHPQRRVLVMTTFPISLIDGEAELPPEVLVEYMDHSSVADTIDPDFARKMRWQPSWAEFIRPLEPTLGSYTVKEGTFVLVPPGQSYTPGSGIAGDVELTTPAMPSISAGVITTTSPEIEQEIILALTAALRGDWQPNPAAEVVK